MKADPNFRAIFCWHNGNGGKSRQKVLCMKSIQDDARYWCCRMGQWEKESNEESIREKGSSVLWCCFFLKGPFSVYGGGHAEDVRTMLTARRT